MPRPVDAVLLDAGNTLVFVDPVRCLDIFREVAGTACDRERFRVAEGRARARLIERLEGGTGTIRGTEAHVWKAYFETLFRESGVPESKLEAVAARIREAHAREHLWSHVQEGTYAALEAILRGGHRLGVISNADGRVASLLEARGLAPFFEFVLDSHVVGVEKPDPGIFRAAVERLGVEPGRCLYVGDLYPVDVVGARGAGLRAVLLDPFDLFAHRGDVDRIPSVADLPAYLRRLENGAGG